MGDFFYFCTGLLAVENGGDLECFFDLGRLRL